MWARLLPPELTDARLFLILWNLCFYIHSTRSWTNLVDGAVAVIAVLVSYFVRSLKAAWFASLLPITAILINHYPFLANHLILILLVNIFLLIIGLTDDFKNIPWVSRVLVALLAVVYMWAGVHKMNWDFLNPEVSCANKALGEYIGASTANQLIFVPYLVLFMQVVFEPLLVFSGTFLLGATLAMGFHAFLAPIGFVHFASIPLVFFGFNWLSRRKLTTLETERWRNAGILYFWVQFLIGVIGLMNLAAKVSKFIMYAQLLVWTIASVAMFWRMWKLAKSTNELSLHQNPKIGWGILVPLIALVMGSANYLGLGTSNSFSMFSNIQTEGSKWNHLFIPKSARIFPYQNQIYYVDKIPSDLVRSVNGNPVPDYGLTALEMYRLFDIWKTMIPLPEVFNVRTDIEEPVDSVYKFLDPDRRPYSYLEYKLLNFRPVQIVGPNQCYW